MLLLKKRSLPLLQHILHSAVLLDEVGGALGHISKSFIRQKVELTSKGKNMFLKDVFYE